MSPAHFTLNNGKNLGKNEEKSRNFYEHKNTIYLNMQINFLVTLVLNISFFLQRCKRKQEIYLKVFYVIQNMYFPKVANFYSLKCYDINQVCQVSYQLPTQIDNRYNLQFLEHRVCILLMYSNTPQAKIPILVSNL